MKKILIFIVIVFFLISSFLFVGNVTIENTEIHKNVNGIENTYISNKPIDKPSEWISIIPKSKSNDYIEDKDNKKFSSSASSSSALTENSKSSYDTRIPLGEVYEVTHVWGADGKINGYRINRGANSMLFDQTGFLDGDVIIKINHTGMDDPNSVLDLYDAIIDQNTKTFTIIRNGEEIEIVNNRIVLPVNNLEINTGEGGGRFDSGESSDYNDAE